MTLYAAKWTIFLFAGFAALSDATAVFVLLKLGFSWLVVLFLVTGMIHTMLAVFSAKYAVIQITGDDVRVKFAILRKPIFFKLSGVSKVETVLGQSVVTMQDGVKHKLAIANLSRDDRERFTRTLEARHLA